MINLITINNVKSLSPWAIVAFSARCARHMQPLFNEINNNKEHRILVEEAIKIAENYASSPPSETYENKIYAQNAGEATEAIPLQLPDIEDTYITIAAVCSASMASHAAGHATNFEEQEYLECVEMLLDNINLLEEKSIKKVKNKKIQEKIREDLNLLIELSKSKKWDKRTAVPNSVFATKRSWWQFWK